MRVIKSCHGLDDARVNIGQGGLYCIAAFQDTDVRGELFIEPGVAVGREAHIGQGIGVVIVLAGRVEDEIRLEFRQDGHNEVIQNVVDPFVCGARRQGDVESAAKCLRPAHLIDEAGARVEGAPVLMEGYTEYIGVVPEDLLSSIAMMNISIDDCDPLMAVLRPQVLDKNCHIIDIAKAPVAVHNAHAVVARWANQCKTVFYLALLQCISQGEGAACRD